MKILYIAHERRAAQGAAGALHAIAPDVTLAWAQTLNAGRRWVQEHQDAGAVIVESDVQGEGCASFVDQVRGLGLTMPVIVVAQEQLGPLFTALRGWLQATLDQKLGHAQSARQDLERRLESELAAAAARLADMEDQHKASLARATRICTTLQARLLEVETALRHAEERRALDAAASAEQLAQRHAEFTAGLAQAAQWRDALAQKLSAATAALEELRQARAADAAAAAERLARREAELEAALAEANAARTEIERTLADARVAQREARARAESDLSAAATRQAALDERLARETDARAALERELAETRTASAHARRRMVETASTVRRRAREQRERLEAHLRAVQVENGTLHGSLREFREQLATTQAALDDDHAAHERARAEGESERERLSAECAQLRQSLDQLGGAFRTLEQVAGQHAMERSRLESLLSEREAQASMEAARHAAAEQSARTALGATEERLRAALEKSRLVPQLEQDNTTIRQELLTARARADSLRRDADRVPPLERQLDETQKENRRQFERAPYGLCVCTPDGTITRVNHSTVRLLGYNRAEDLLQSGFPASVFECTSDLDWLIERTIATGTRESVETTWKRRDGRRVPVRLHALSSTPESITVAVEEMTNLRAVEQRLHQAERMEAVGRVASEVASTCESLLRDVAREGREWLAAMNGDAGLRPQGESLLADVTRATGFLRQLAVYGNEQVKALEPVSVQRVLRDLEPVLKRVAGDDVELVLPKSSAPFLVDVDAERVERILVNVASYARGRLPNSGRVRIDLATTVVDRRFIAKYPGVRPGAHVLITITEIPGTGRAASPGEAIVDLGALLGLIGDCGGHLWMEAEPSGTLTLKIRLPKRVSDDIPESLAPAAAANRRRPLARWLRSPRAKAASGSPVS